MTRTQINETVAIIRRMLDALLATVPAKGRAGADLRAACGVLRVNAAILLNENTIAKPLGACFEFARQAGATLPQIIRVQQTLAMESPISLPATSVTNACLRFALATESMIIARMVFNSREEVDQVKTTMNDGFNAAEEIAADSMDSITYQALISTHAAVTAYLVETARPLPRMLQFYFAQPMSTITVAHRLYYDMTRADQLRAENKVVHPAFMLPKGQALSR